MIESSTESVMGTWSAPECPYLVEYAPRVLDDIRLAVVDAFFSLPRGGAEIGGILLGSHSETGVSILDYRALDCEHATGPSFTLSQNDLAQLADLLATAPKESGLVPVGWYHSHTRSDIFLSEADQGIHNRFFPKPWQVALVLKPSTFEPTRAGFFFRERDGSMRGSASYREFTLEALPIRQIPTGDAPPASPLARPLPDQMELDGAVITQTPQPVVPAGPPPAVAAAPVKEEAAQSREPVEPRAAAAEEPLPDLTPPRFLQTEPQGLWRWVKSFVAVGVGAALGAGVYQYRGMWLPAVEQRLAPLAARVRPVLPKEALPVLSLALADHDGQLQISWNGKSPAIVNADGGTLEITDGAAPMQTVPLDFAHLEAGAFTYGRQGERVEVRLKVGDNAKETASFLGKLPEQKAPVEDPAVTQERDELRQQTARLKQELENEAARTRRLEKALNDVKEQLAKESQRRLANQAPDAGKK